MIKQYEVGQWLTTKQNISTNKGELVDALILNSIFRLNADTPLGDIAEIQLVEKIKMAKNKLQHEEDFDIDKIVEEVIYG